MNLSSDYPPADRGRVVVWGLLGARPFGGMTWQVLHYVVGLRRLGVDVWYVEDSDRVLLDPVRFWPTVKYEPNVAYLARHMDSVGLGDRWVFRPPENENGCLGAVDSEGLARLYGEADAVVNLCGAQELRPEHDSIRCRVYLQTDPTADQVRVARGDSDKIRELDAYDHLFTYGENLGEPDCLVPVERHRWKTTRPPVIVDWWDTGGVPPDENMLTTVTNWKKHRDKEVVWNDRTWRWNKQDELRRYIDLPSRSSLPLGMAVAAIDEQDQALLRRHGWHVTAATELADPHAYANYIRRSVGEFTIAKEQYVLPRTGWFSDRSVCYLASGRPVVTEDTGFSKRIATGEGLFAFSDEDEALRCIESVARDYPRQCATALEIARTFFDAGTVLRDLLRQIGLF